MKLKVNFNREISLLSKLILVMIIVVLGSCEKCNDPCDIDCDNYDPCCGQSPADARFTIYEPVGGSLPNEGRDGFRVEHAATDTILQYNFALFKANFEADYYEWQVGNDPRVWNTREFSLRFASVPVYTPIEIKLKVYKKTDKRCFPSASDTAVFSRKLYTAPADSSRVLGRFEGFLESKPSEPNFFELDIISDNWGDRRYAIAGITPKCNADQINGGLENLDLGYKSFYINTRGTKIGCCNGLTAFGVVNSSRELRMDFGIFPFNPSDTCEWDVIDDPFVNDTFKGTKQ